MPHPTCNHGNPWDDCAVCEFDDTPTTTAPTESLSEQMDKIAVSNRPTVSLRANIVPNQSRAVTEDLRPGNKG